MGELQVKVVQNLGVIEFNFEELKDNLSNMMQAYEGATFHEDTVIGAKAEVATLRKIKKALSDRRIEVKKEYMKPYDDFETKVKELTALIDKPIELIDSQVKAFEEKQKAEKKEKILALYNELIGEMEEYLPLSKIYDGKWENKATTIKSIKEEIEQVVSSTKMAVETIKGMNSESVPKALEQYKYNLSLADAIAYINKYEQQKAEILAKEEARRKEEEERKRIVEEERIRKEERQKIVDEQKKKEEEEIKIETAIQSAKEEVIESLTPVEEDTLSLYEYRIELGEDSKKKLEMYMDSVGIEWEEI